MHLACVVYRFGPGEAATWKPAVSGELSPFAAALRAVDEMDPETAQLMLHKGKFYFLGIVCRIHQQARLCGRYC